MPIPARYVQTNLTTRDWRRLVPFYGDVFGCVPQRRRAIFPATGWISSPRCRAPTSPFSRECPGTATKCKRWSSTATAGWARAPVRSWTNAAPATSPSESGAWWPLCRLGAAAVPRLARHAEAVGRERDSLSRELSPPIKGHSRKLPQIQKSHRFTPENPSVAFLNLREKLSFQEFPKVNEVERRPVRSAPWRRLPFCAGEKHSTRRSRPRLADHRSATQQVGNLRYGGRESCHRWAA